MRDGIDGAALDRWITGNYGEDQFKCPSCGGEHDEQEEYDNCAEEMEAAEEAAAEDRAERIAERKLADMEDRGDRFDPWI
jgi:hypothetical protein